MNKKTLCGALYLLAVLAMGFSDASAAEKIKKEKLQVFIMLGQRRVLCRGERCLGQRNGGINEEG